MKNHSGSSTNFEGNTRSTEFDICFHPLILCARTVLYENWFFIEISHFRFVSFGSCTLHELFFTNQNSPDMETPFYATTSPVYTDVSLPIFTTLCPSSPKRCPNWVEYEGDHGVSCRGTLVLRDCIDYNNVSPKSDTGNSPEYIPGNQTYCPRYADVTPEYTPASPSYDQLPTYHVAVEPANVSLQKAEPSDSPEYLHSSPSYEQLSRFDEAVDLAPRSQVVPSAFYSLSSFVDSAQQSCVPHVGIAPIFSILSQKPANVH